MPGLLGGDEREIWGRNPGVNTGVYSTQPGYLSRHDMTGDEILKSNASDPLNKMIKYLTLALSSMVIGGSMFGGAGGGAGGGGGGAGAGKVANMNQMNALSSGGGGTASVPAGGGNAFTNFFKDQFGSFDSPQNAQNSLGNIQNVQGLLGGGQQQQPDFSAAQQAQERERQKRQSLLYRRRT